MNILINIGHPAHVHFFKNFIGIMEERGHNIFINTIDKDVTIELLNKYSLKYQIYGKRSNNLLVNSLYMLKGDIATYKLQKEHNIHIFIGILDELGAHISKLTKATSISFTDTEHAKLNNLITLPFTDFILTPQSFKKDLGKKHIRYNGYHELAYLHPNYFTPDPQGLEDYIIVRFVSWKASHDIGHHGIQNKLEFIRRLQTYAKVLITSESTLEPELQKYKLTTSPEKLHHLLYHATLYIGEGTTTASEAATLGTHAISISTEAKHCGIFTELKKYGLAWTYDDETEVFELIEHLLKNKQLKAQGKQKRQQLLKDKIDVTRFMADFVEGICKC